LQSQKVDRISEQPPYRPQGDQQARCYPSRDVELDLEKALNRAGSSTAEPALAGTSPWLPFLAWRCDALDHLLAAVGEVIEAL
jgi:hypothetical protein